MSGKNRLVWYHNENRLRSHTRLKEIKLLNFSLSSLDFFFFSLSSLVFSPVWWSTTKQYYSRVERYASTWDSSLDYFSYALCPTASQLFALDIHFMVREECVTAVTNGDDRIKITARNVIGFRVKSTSSVTRIIFNSVRCFSANK